MGFDTGIFYHLRYLLTHRRLAKSLSTKGIEKGRQVRKDMGFCIATILIQFNIGMSLEIYKCTFFLIA